MLAMPTALAYPMGAVADQSHIRREFSDFIGWAVAFEYEGLYGVGDFKNSIGFRFG